MKNTPLSTKDCLGNMENQLQKGKILADISVKKHMSCQNAQDCILTNGIYQCLNCIKYKQLDS